MLFSAPVDVPVIVGHEHNRIIHVIVGTPIVLTCRADYFEPPFLLTWTNELEIKQETTAVGETTTMNIVHTDEPGENNDRPTIGENNTTSVPTLANTNITVNERSNADTVHNQTANGGHYFPNGSIDTNSTENGYYTVDTTQLTPLNNTVAVNDTWLNNGDGGTNSYTTSMHETHLHDAMSTNRTSKNTTDLVDESGMLDISSSREVGRTSSVDPVETMTGIVRSTNETVIDIEASVTMTPPGVTDGEFEINATYDTVTISKEDEWATSYDGVSTTVLPPYTPDEEPIQVINSLPGTR